MKEAAAATKATGTAVAKTAPKKQPPALIVKGLIEKRMDDIKKALPAVITPERFVRIATTAVSANPKLAEAASKSPMTFLGALMTAAQLGVEPNTPLGQAYLIPFNNSRLVDGTWVKVPEVTFQLGYQGIIDLCYRSGEVTMINAQVVYENDEFEYELGLDQKLRHIPAKKNRGKPEYYYGVFKTKSGASGFQVMSYEDVLEHAKKFSKSYNAKTGKFSGPWESDFNSMSKKTVLLAALKYAPKKSDFVKAIVNDNTVKSNIAEDMSSVNNDDVIDVEAVEPTEADVAEEKERTKANA